MMVEASDMRIDPDGDANGTCRVSYRELSKSFSVTSREKDELGPLLYENYLSHFCHANVTTISVILIVMLE